MSGKKHVLHSIHHFITAAVLIIKGIDKISHHTVIGSLVLLFGMIIFIFFIYSVTSKLHGENLELTVRWFEAFVSLFMAYIFFSEGRTFIQYVFLLAAVGFFISIYMFQRKEKYKRAG